METLFDKRKIPDVGICMFEAYNRYGKNDLTDMTESELKKELARTNKEIETLQQELDDSDNSFPIYALKEKIEDAMYYKEKIEKALENYKTESVHLDRSFHSFKNQLKDYRKK